MGFPEALEDKLSRLFIIDTLFNCTFDDKIEKHQLSTRTLSNIAFVISFKLRVSKDMFTLFLPISLLEETMAND